MSELRFARDVEIRDIVLTNNQGTKVSLYNVFVDLAIFESIFSSSLSANITLMDAHNFLSLFSISGGEKVEIEFKTAGFPDYTFLEMYVFKVSRRIHERERTHSFNLALVSKEELVNSGSMVSRAFSGTHDQMIREVFTSHLLSTKLLETEECLFRDKIVSPNWRPFEVINFIAGRAMPKNFKGSHMLFYETIKGFRFKSLESMLSQDAVLDFTYSPRNIREQNPERFQHRTLEQDMLKVESYEIMESFDLIDMLRKGTFKNKLATFDFLRKKYREWDFDYAQSFADYEHLEKEKIIPENQQFVQNNSRMFFKSKHSFLHNNLNNDNRSEAREQIKNSQIEQLQNLRINIGVAGDSELTVGSVVNFWLPSNESMESSKLIDDYLSGRFLVTGIRHNIKTDNYFMNVELLKDSLSTPLGEQINPDNLQV